MRVVYISSETSSFPIFEALAKRAADPADPVELAAVVWPRRFESKQDERSFNSKRRIVDLLNAIPGRRARQIIDRAKDPGIWVQLQRLARAADAPLLFPGSLAAPELLAQVKGLDADVAIVAALDRIIKGPVFDAFPPFYNIHPSFLPENRGGEPTFWQLAGGMTEGGVTLHRIDSGVDTGPIVLQQRVPINPWDDSKEFGARWIAVAIDLLNQFLDGYPGIVDGAKAQTGGSYQRLPTEADRTVPFDDPIETVIDRARAVGWDAPLLIHMPRDAWEDRQPSRAAPASAETVTLQLFDPVAFVDAQAGAPGSMQPTATGGLLIACGSGCVLFRRAIVRA